MSRRCAQLRRMLELCLLLVESGPEGLALADLAGPLGVCERTVRRDLALLVSMDWARVDRPGRWTWSKGQPITPPTLDDVATWKVLEFQAGTYCSRQ